MAFLNCRPSVIAASILYVERRAQGCIPFWPTMLAKLTGYQVRWRGGKGRGLQNRHVSLLAADRLLQLPCALQQGAARCFGMQLSPDYPFCLMLCLSWPCLPLLSCSVQDMSTPELAVSIKAAQRLAARSTRSPLTPAGSITGSSIASSHSHSLTSRSSSSTSLSSLVAAAAAAGAGANGALPPGLAVPVQVPSSAALLSTAPPVSAPAVVVSNGAGRLSANSSLELPLPPTTGAGSPAVAPMLAPPPAASHRGAASIEQQLFALQHALGPAMHAANGSGVPAAALMDHMAMLPHGHSAQRSALAGAGAGGTLPLHAVTAGLPVGHTGALGGEGLPLPLISSLHGFPLAAGVLPAAAALHPHIPGQLLAPTQPVALMVGGPTGQLGSHHGAAAHFHTNHYFGN